MDKVEKIKIITHQNPTPISDRGGDILRPFTSWQTTDTGGGWFSKVPEEFYDDKPYYPLVAVAHNPWDALQKLSILHFDFKEMVQYVCPYNKYEHFWAVPVLIFTDDVKSWVWKYRTGKEANYMDREWVKKFFPPKVKDGLPFTKIQRALLGPGFTKANHVHEGRGYIYDAIVALDNDDFIGVKVWVWFGNR